MSDSEVERELERAALLKNFKNRLDALTEEFENFKEESVTKDELAEYFTQDVTIVSVNITENEYVAFKLSDERIISIPIWWSSKLEDAKGDVSIFNFKISEDGKRVKWPKASEEITLYGILQGSPSSE